MTTILVQHDFTHAQTHKYLYTAHHTPLQYFMFNYAAKSHANLKGILSVKMETSNY